VTELTVANIRYVDAKRLRLGRLLAGASGRDPDAGR
jgi:hypothetical protein